MGEVCRQTKQIWHAVIRGEARNGLLQRRLHSEAVPENSEFGGVSSEDLVDECTLIDGDGFLLPSIVHKRRLRASSLAAEAAMVGNDPAPNRALYSVTESEPGQGWSSMREKNESDMLEGGESERGPCIAHDLKSTHATNTFRLSRCECSLTELGLSMLSSE